MSDKMYSRAIHNCQLCKLKLKFLIERDKSLCYWIWQFFSEYDIKNTDNKVKVDKVDYGGISPCHKNNQWVKTKPID